MDDQSPADQSHVDYLRRQYYKYWQRVRRFLKLHVMKLKTLLNLEPRPPCLWNLIKYGSKLAAALYHTALSTLPKCLRSFAGSKYNLPPGSLAPPKLPDPPKGGPDEFHSLSKRVGLLDQLLAKRDAEILSDSIRKDKVAMRDWMIQNLNPALPAVTIEDKDLRKLSLREVYTFCLTTGVKHSASLSSISALPKPAGITREVMIDILNLHSRIAVQTSTKVPLPNEVWDRILHHSKFHLDVKDNREYTYSTDFVCRKCNARIYERDTKRLKHQSCLCSLNRPDRKELNSLRIGRLSRW